MKVFFYFVTNFGCFLLIWGLFYIKIVFRARPRRILRPTSNADKKCEPCLKPAWIFRNETIPLKRNLVKEGLTITENFAITMDIFQSQIAQEMSGPVWSTLQKVKIERNMEIVHPEYGSDQDSNLPFISSFP